MGYGKTYKTKWLEDLSGNQGTANQVLISTSAGIAWATASTVIGGPYLPLSGGTMTGNTTHGDNVRSLYGASSDMQIYHDGSNSYVRDVGTGRLWIDSNGEGVSIISDGSGSTPMAHFYKDGAVELYHNNVRRFKTNDLGGVSIDHTSGSMGNSFFGSVSGATNGFQIANSSSNEMTYTFQNGSNSQVLKILNNGNVGIGTTSPQSLLHIASTNPILTIQDTDATTTFNRTEIQNSSGTLLFNTRQSNGTFVSTDYSSLKNATGATTHQWFISGSEKMRINSSGNVGIGTASPSAKLDVAGTGNFTGLVSGITPVAAANFATKSYVDAHGGGTGPFLPLAGGTMTGNTIHNDGVKSFYGTDSDLQILHDGSNSYIADTGTGALFIDSSKTNFQINGSTVMNINFDSKVGIGTTNPDEKLRVDGNIKSAGDFIGAALKLGFAGSANITTNDTNEDLLINPNGSGDILMQTTSTGNVGIGTASPAEKLEVNGNIKVIKSGQTPDVSVFHSDGSYAKLRGQGLFLSRSTSYVAPVADNFGSLAVGYNGARWGNVEINAAIVKFENGANEFMRITSSGNVGIGTTSPDYQLEVEKTSAQATIGITGGATDARLHLKTNNGNWMLQNDYSNNGALSFYNSGHRLVVAKNGNVGIGTTSPLCKLHIDEAGTSLPALFMETARYGISVIGDGTSNSQYLLSLKGNGGSTDAMFVQSSGNVGIGTTSPSEKLEVDGNVKVTGDLKMDNNKGVQIKDNGGALRDVLKFASNNQIQIGSSAIGGDIRFLNTGDYTFENGNVGIGTTSPLAKLDISTSGNTAIPGLGAVPGASTSAIFRNSGNTVILAAGVSNTNVSWLQGRQTTGTGNAFNIALNPLGGNVGIGTTSPTEKLHIFGTTAAVKIEGNGVTSANLKFKTNETDRWNVNVPSGSTDLRFTTGSSDTLTLKSNGNVGIGTTSPQGTLSVKPSQFRELDFIESNSQMTMRSTAPDTSYNLRALGIESSDIVFRTGSTSGTTSTQRMVINSSGNVGIGTTSPSAKLQVDGDVRISGDKYYQMGGSNFKIGADGGGSAMHFYSGGNENMTLNSSGNVGIGTTAPNASALLDVSSTTKGVLLPRMSTTQINAISSPAEGLTVYNTVLSTLCFFNGVSWQKVTSTAM